MTLMPKERRKQLIFDYLRGLKNPVTAEHVGEKFKIKEAAELLMEVHEQRMKEKEEWKQHAGDRA